jgi:hypothetical protein
MLVAAETLLPNGPGDVWSILIGVLSFAILFAVVRLLERV